MNINESTFLISTVPANGTQPDKVFVVLQEGSRATGFVFSVENAEAVALSLLNACKKLKDAAPAKTEEVEKS